MHYYTSAYGPDDDANVSTLGWVADAIAGKSRKTRRWKREEADRPESVRRSGITLPLLTREMIDLII